MPVLAVKSLPSLYYGITQRRSCSMGTRLSHRSVPVRLDRRSARAGLVFAESTSEDRSRLNAVPPDEQQTAGPSGRNPNRFSHRTEYVDSGHIFDDRPLTARLEDAKREERAQAKAVMETLATAADRRLALRNITRKRQRLAEQLAAQEAADASQAKALERRKQRKERAQQRLQQQSSRSSTQQPGSSGGDVKVSAPRLQAKGLGSRRARRPRRSIRRFGGYTGGPVSPASGPPPPGEEGGVTGEDGEEEGEEGEEAGLSEDQSWEPDAHHAEMDTQLSSMDEMLDVLESGDLPGDDDVCVLPKPIFVLSDCTGESAANSVRAALGQFEQCMDMSCPTNLEIHRFVSREEQVYGIVRTAAAEDGLIVYTLVDGVLKSAVDTASRLYSVTAVDLWGGLLDGIENHLEVARSGIPLGKRQNSQALSRDYYRMIEAVEYTRKHDDGAMPENWKDADLLLLGVSRTGKTPLSIYLGQRGYKVANLPLVPLHGELFIPKQLHEIDQHRVVGLLIEPETLITIRTSRLNAMGVGAESTPRSGYDDITTCRHEVALAKALYDKHPTWPVLNVTHSAVEETAARILRIFDERNIRPDGTGEGDKYCNPKSQAQGR